MHGDDAGAGGCSGAETWRPASVNTGTFRQHQHHWPPGGRQAPNQHWITDYAATEAEAGLLRARTPCPLPLG